MNKRLVHVVLLSLCLAPLHLRAEDNQKALFALIIGVNQSVDEELKPLQYADDDAARYFDLFRSLGARAYLLTRPDENTSRLHPQAMAEAYQPRQEQLDRVLDLLAENVRQARERNVGAVLYFVYAGHGKVKDGQGTITLEDAHLSGKQLAEQVVGQVGADQVHLIVDACYSYFLAHTRGPGGHRRSIHGFSQVDSLAGLKNVGMLLSTSSTSESHEWEAFQAGVFSHEVRSGLYGPADANRDGQVSYREIAAFVEQANSPIPNDRFRPRVFARPPAGSDLLLDISHVQNRSLEVDKEQHGRYFLEDSRGIRLADFHSGPSQSVALMRPAAPGPLYLHRPDDQKEFVLPEDPGKVSLASLTAQEPRSRERGAAHHAFSLLFSEPFDQQTVDKFTFPTLDDVMEVSAEQPADWRSYVGWGSLGLGTAAALTGGILTVVAAYERSQAEDGNQREVADTNRRIDQYNQAAVTLYCLAGATVIAGIVTLLLPEDDIPYAGFGLTPDGAVLTIGGTF
jgi:hypothetical protein